MSAAQTYWALVFKEPETDFWITIPDLPGCFSSGETPEEAIANMQEAIVTHVEVMKERGMKLPEARNEAQVLKSDDLPAFFKTAQITIN